MSRKLLTIWFDDKGNMIDRASTWKVSNPSQYHILSELGEDFDETFVYHRMYGIKVVFRSKKSGRKFLMFLDDFGDALKLNKLQNNEISGKFRFTKKGQSQGFKFIWTSQEQELLDKNDD